jgi:hypothetical protein
MLRLASDVFNLILKPHSTEARGIHAQTLLAILEWKISNVPIFEEHENSMPGQRIPACWGTMELFQLTLLVFLERASSGASGKSGKLSDKLDRAFSLIDQLETFERQFPLLILGCEARNDWEKIAILGLISRTEQNSRTRSLGNIKSLLQSLWAQEDLAQHGLVYTAKIRAVLGSSGILPAFV